MRLSAKSPSTPIRPQTTPNPSASGRFRFKPGISVNSPQMIIEPRMPAKKPSQLFFGLTRGALEKEIVGLYEKAAVTGFSAGEVDMTTRMDIPCPLHWVLRGGEDGLLAVWQNTTGEALSVVRKTDIPVTAAAEEEQDELRDGRMFDDVQALEGYLESLSS